MTKRNVQILYNFSRWKGFYLAVYKIKKKHVLTLIEAPSPIQYASLANAFAGGHLGVLTDWAERDTEMVRHCCKIYE